MSPLFQCAVKFTQWEEFQLLGRASKDRALIGLHHLFHKVELCRTTHTARPEKAFERIIENFAQVEPVSLRPLPDSVE